MIQMRISSTGSTALRPTRITENAASDQRSHFVRRLIASVPRSLKLDGLIMGHVSAWTST